MVDYAHTPAALETVLGEARALVPGARVLVVFGCGGNRDRAKRPLMGEVATRLADVSVLTADNPRDEDPETIAAEVIAGTRPGALDDGSLIVNLDRRRAIEVALQGARAGDVVVVAGKGHEQYQEVAGTRLAFDDREVARSLLGIGAH
jgi:UDP-N-acetylmuramoyl-L-alanyl-D-glutamate--2,6-diaminopimelate ligase